MSKKPYLKIEVKVKPKSMTSEIVKVNDLNYIAYLHSLPINNKANWELLHLLSSYFKVNQAKIKIIRGLNNKSKIIGFYE